jgi:hypothetical protein
MYDNEGMIVILIALLIAILAFVMGSSSALKYSEREAVKAGVGYYTADEEGDSAFEFITPCTNCVVK